MEYERVSLNTRIRFKLTDAGRRHVVATLKEYGMPDPMRHAAESYRVDAKGFAETELWDFCNMFGKAMINGTLPKDMPVSDLSIWVPKQPPESHPQRPNPPPPDLGCERPKCPGVSRCHRFACRFFGPKDL